MKKLNPIAAVFMMLCTALSTAAAADDVYLSYWDDMVVETTAAAFSKDSVRHGMLWKELTEKLKTDPSFMQFVESALQRDTLEPARVLAAAQIAIVRGTNAHDLRIALMMLADPEMAVQGWGRHGHHRFAKEQRIQILTLALLSEHSAVRRNALVSLGLSFKGDGLPYYVRMLRDPEFSVAAKAAEQLRHCAPDDIKLPLWRFLKEKQPDEFALPHVKAALDTLQHRFKLDMDASEALAAQVERWIKHLEERLIVR